MRLFYLARIMGTSVAQLDATYGHLSPTRRTTSAAAFVPESRCRCECRHCGDGSRGFASHRLRGALRRDNTVSFTMEHCADSGYALSERQASQIDDLGRNGVEASAWRQW